MAYPIFVIRTFYTSCNEELLPKGPNMGALKDIAKAVGNVMDKTYERNQKIDEMTRQIVKRGYGLDPIEAKKVAAILVDQAEVTWK